MNAPCKDCKDRHMLCHSSCSKYLAYAAERDLERQERLKQQDAAAMANKRINSIMQDLHRKKRK